MHSELRPEQAALRDKLARQEALPAAQKAAVDALKGVSIAVLVQRLSGTHGRRLAEEEHAYLEARLARDALLDEVAVLGGACLRLEQQLATLGDAEVLQARQSRLHAEVAAAQDPRRAEVFGQLHEGSLPCPACEGADNLKNQLMPPKNIRQPGRACVDVAYAVRRARTQTTFMIGSCLHSKTVDQGTRVLL